MSAFPFLIRISRFQNEIAMEDVTPTHVRPSNSTQQLTLTSGATYMHLQDATPSGNDRTDQSRPNNPQLQSPSQGAEYAPLNPRTRSWEVARDHVTIEKIIGKGAFGQVAKGTANDLPGRPGKTTVAIKMLKSKSSFVLFCLGTTAVLRELLSLLSRGWFYLYFTINPPVTHY